MVQTSSVVTTASQSELQELSVNSESGIKYSLSALILDGGSALQELKPSSSQREDYRPGERNAQALRLKVTTRVYSEANRILQGRSDKNS